MNRYTIAGIIADVTAGRRVLVITADVRASRNALADVADALHDAGLGEDVRVRSTNGLERIDGPAGGGVRFRSVRQGAHGLAADVLVLEADPSPHELASLMPAIAASPVRELIR